ncbi:hypothetical protein BDZ94DRAFT_1313825 [Collybia nuda]|uniref:Uncharacterized protein n=1 Tax=Collybia nuda TaxID=64659 RepID=A0A9P5XUI1_9AGAR|nr:hypothetical protein BDZ94DRAFT_1313825 [Collybia nuda]
MVLIPYDVWLVIIQFLPDETVQNLLGLNHACFDTVMSRRYRVVNITHGDRDKRANRYLLHLQNRYIAQRVRILHISFSGFLPEQLEVLRRGLVSKMADTARQTLFKRGYVTRAQSTQSLQMTRYNDELASTLAGMSALTDLHLHYDTPAENLVPLASVTRNPLGSNLRYLLLSGTLYNIAEAVRFPVVFEKIECISLHLGPTQVHSGPIMLEDVSRRITSFINGHHATLQDLELSYKFKFDSPSELSFVLDGLGYFSRLHAFQLQASLDSGLGLYALHKIISAHQHQLVTVIITHRLPATFWEGTTLPILESLNLAMNAEDPHMIEAVISLLIRLEPSLIGFKLKTDYQFSDQELYKILGVFTPRSKLRRLALPLDFLSPRVLEFVATNLPELQLKLVNSHFMVE